MYFRIVEFKYYGFAAFAGEPEAFAVELAARPGLLSTAITSFVKSMLSCEYSQDGNAVNAHAGFIEHEIQIVGFNFLHHHIGDLFHDSLSHAHQLFLQLPFSGLTEIADFPFHVFDVCNLVIPLLGRRRFLIRAQGR